MKNGGQQKYLHKALQGHWPWTPKGGLTALHMNPSCNSQRAGIGWVMAHDNKTQSLYIYIYIYMSCSYSDIAMYRFDIKGQVCNVGKGLEMTCSVSGTIPWKNCKRFLSS